MPAHPFSNVNLQFKKPNIVLQELKKKYNCSRIYSIREKLGGAKDKGDRELFYGSLFAEILNKISKHKYLIRMPEKDEECDVELIDHSEWQNNQKLPKNQRKADHFLLQNVQITEHVVVNELRRGNNNIYEIFKQHLNRTKLSPKAGDYAGCILVFYLNLKINEKIGLRELRSMVRECNQDKFQQIWVVIPNVEKYGVAELCRSEEQFMIADFLNN
jgi:hypothetical protein